MKTYLPLLFILVACQPSDKKTIPDSSGSSDESSEVVAHRDTTIYRPPDYGDPDTLFASGGILDTFASPNEIAEEGTSAHFTVERENYDLILYNWFGGDMGVPMISNEDSAYLTEDVFYTLSEKVSRIVPHDTSDRFIVSLLISERLTELNGYYDSAWTGTIGYRILEEPHPGFFKFPSFYPDYENRRKELFNLGDTLVSGRGEMAPVATVIYEGIPHWYKLDYGILRVERYSNDQLADVDYIYILFSWGC